MALLCLVALPGMAPPPSVSLEVEVTRLRSAKGMLRLCLTADPKGFPDCKSGQVVTRTVSAASPHVRFDGLAPGSYALAVIHDENGNARLDTFVGIPREGFGFSRNPGIGFGPPGFDAVRFPVGGSDASVQQVRIRYLL